MEKNIVLFFEHKLLPLSINNCTITLINDLRRDVYFMAFISYLINGVSLGSVYAIIALGYTMVYGIAKMLNFAHGDIIMIGAYAVYVIVSVLGLPVWLGIIVSVVLCTVLGILIEKIAYKPLRNSSPLAVLITAIGVSYFLQNVALIIFGANTKSFASVVSVPARSPALFITVP